MKRQPLHRNMQDRTMHAMNSRASILILSSLRGALAPLVDYPWVEPVPRMRAMSDLSNEELRLQCSHLITRLYSWSVTEILVRQKYWSGGPIFQEMF